MLELFTIGTFWFWFLLTITFGLITYKISDEDGYSATFVLVVFFALFFSLGNFDLLVDLGNFIKDNPLKFFLYIITYLFSGSIWSIVKWYFFLLDYKKRFLNKKAENYKTIPTLEIPQASKNKGDIIRWMSYWPISLFWTIFSDWVRKIWNRIYESLESVYDNLAKKVFKDLQ